MKKYLLSAALSTVLFAGCQNEEIVSSENANQSELTVQVTKGVSSRLEMNSNGKMVWSEGDQLFVYGTKACGVLTLVDGADEETATFSGFINGNTSDIQYAAFGFDKSSTPENVTFTIGTVNADECNAPMFGTFNSTNNSIELSNLCGLVKVTISDMVSGKDDATITGKGIAGTLKLENGKLIPGTADATITVGGIEDGESFYVPMFAPQDKTPVELTVTYNGAVDKQVVNLKAGALNISDMPDSYYFVEGKNVLYSDDLNDGENEQVQDIEGVLKNEDGEYIVSEDGGIEYVLDLDEKNIVINLASDLTVNVKPWQTLAFGGESTVTITINGNGNTLTFNQLDSDWNHVTTVNNAKLTINNAHITSSGHNDGPWNRHDINFACPVELVDVISDKAIALKNAGILTNVTINDANTDDTYAIWIQPLGQTVTVQDCTIDMLGCADGRGIKIDNQYIGDSKEDDPSDKIEGKVTLNVSGTTFKTEEKSAIIVKTTVGANINLEGNNIEGVAEDKVCAVWVDEDAPSSYDLVMVNGGCKKLEGADFYVDEDGKASTNSNIGLAEAITSGATEVKLEEGEGEYIIPSVAQGKTLKIVGTGNPEDVNVAVTKIGAGGENCDYGLDGSTVTFEGVTITTNSSTYIGYARCNGTYKNCIINGTYTLYGNSVFEECEFNVSGDVYNIWTWGAPTAQFTKCTFNCDGKAVLLYGTANTKLTMNNCTFNDNGGLSDLKAAIEIGNDYGKSYELIVNNAIVNGFAINDKGINTGTTLWANKNSMGTDKLNVVVDGVDVY